MRGGAAGLMAVLVLAGCVAIDDNMAAGMDVPDGYPPKIGEVVADLSGASQRWDTYDYSIGAFDAAVQVMDFNGEIQLRLMGEPAGKPQSKTNRLLMKAVMSDRLQTGALTGVVIEIIAGEEFDGLRLSSQGSAASVVVDKIAADPARDVIGHVTGRFSAVLCATTGQPAVVDRGKCQPIRGTFDSDMQFSGV